MITNKDSNKEILKELDSGDGIFLRAIDIFSDLTDIVRPSHKEEAVRNYVANWAEKNQFKYKKDKAGNIAVYVDYNGEEYKNSPSVILQSHMDMVTKGGNDVAPTEAEIVEEKDGPWIQSKDKKTTLGADNGAGMVMKMALAEDKNFHHGPLTLLFTANEEHGFSGASGLDTDLLPKNAEILINLDSALGEKRVCNGSAGGEPLAFNIDVVDEEQIPENYQPLQIDLKGLLGGHSGFEIDKQRGNAVYVLATMLNALIEENEDKIDVKLIEITTDKEARGGAIPDSASCKIAVPAQFSNYVKEFLKAFEDSDEFSTLGMPISKENHNEVKIEVNELATGEVKAVSNETRNKIFGLIGDVCELPLKKDGANVLKSSNLGIMSTDMAADGKKSFVFKIFSRAFHDNDLDERIKKLKEIYLNSGAKITSKGRMSGWMEDPMSKAVQITKEAIQEVLNEEAEVAPIPVGLEVAEIVKKAKEVGINTSNIAIGALLEYPHSINERVSLKSIAKTIKVIKRMLEKAL